MLRRKGFTLIELLVVVAIISLLAAIAVPRLVERIRRARMTRAEADIRGIENALAMLVTDAGAPLLMLLREGTDVYRQVAPPLPGGLGGLYDPHPDSPYNAFRKGLWTTQLVNGIFKSSVEYEPGGSWAGVLKPGVYKNLSMAYMDKGIPTDPWGEPYHILLAPPDRYARYGWVRPWEELVRGFPNYYYGSGWPGFRSYGGERGQLEPAPPALDQYIYSMGENRTDNTLLAPPYNAYDDVNNYDAEQGYTEVYR